MANDSFRPLGPLSRRINSSGTQTGIVDQNGVAVVLGTGDMVAANNLSELTATAATARENLGSTTVGDALFVAASAAAARTAIGAVIGTNVQAYDADLDAVAALSPSNDDIIQRKAGAWTNRTVAQYLVDLQGDGLLSGAAGFRYIPQNAQSAAYAIVAADSGKSVHHPAADATARTFTLPANASVAFPIGTSITFTNGNGAGVVTIAITSDTLRFASDGTTGNRSLAANGMATAMKVTATEWLISGVGLT